MPKINDDERRPPKLPKKQEVPPYLQPGLPRCGVRESTKVEVVMDALLLACEDLPEPYKGKCDNPDEWEDRCNGYENDVEYVQKIADELRQSIVMSQGGTDYIRRTEID